MNNRRRARGNTTTWTECHAVDGESIPEPVQEELSRVIYEMVREFFNDLEDWDDYEQWLVAYRQLHPPEGFFPDALESFESLQQEG